MDLSSAKERAKRLMLCQTDQLKPAVDNYRRSRGQALIAEDDVELIHRNGNHFDVKYQIGVKIVDMCYEIGRDCFWHAFDDWPEIRQHLTAEEIQFFAETMIAIARAYDPEEHNSSAMPFVWILSVYDNGFLTEWISDELVTEAAGKAFLEFGRRHFSKSTHLAAVYEEQHLETLGKYFPRANPVQMMAERGPGWRLSNTHLWVRDWYIDTVNGWAEAAKTGQIKLSTGDLGWLYRPIVDCHYQVIFHEDSVFWQSTERMQKAWDEAVSPEAVWLPTETVQSLIRERITDQFQRSHQQLSGVGARIKFLRQRLTGEAAEIQAFFDSILDDKLMKGNDWALDFRHCNIQTDWFSAAGLAKIEANLRRYLLSTPDFSQQQRPAPIMYHLEETQEAVLAGWLNIGWAKARIATKLREYLKGSPRAGASIVDLAKILRPNFAPPELYAQVIDRVIADAEHRNCLSTLLGAVNREYVGNDTYAGLIEKTLVTMRVLPNVDPKDIAYWDGVLRNLQSRAAKQPS